MISLLNYAVLRIYNMANSKQAIKRAKQNAQKYKLRHAQRSVVRTAIKAARTSIETKDVTKAKELIQKAEKSIIEFFSLD